MKILIIKTSSLGDLIHVFPVIEYLKARFPQAQIDWVVEKPFADLIKAHPLINTVLTINTKNWRKNLWEADTWRDIGTFRRELQKNEYDVVFDLQGNTKSGIATGLARSQVKVGFARPYVPEMPNTFFTNKRFGLASGNNIRQDYLSLVKQYYQDESLFRYVGVTLEISLQEHAKIARILECAELQSSRLVMVCAGSIWPNKQLSNEALLGFLRLVSTEAPTSFLFVWGSVDEKKMAENLKAYFAQNAIVLDKLPLPTLQNLMAKVDLVVAMDSLPLHLAGAAGVPTFSAFGASSAAKYKPEGSQHLYIQGACPYGRKFERRCPVLRTCPTGACLKNITAETLFEAYNSGIQEKLSFDK